MAEPIQSRKAFVKGVMDKETDERLLPNGAIRHAENVQILSSEGSDVGSAHNILPTKKLTNLDLGENVKCLLGVNDEFRDKIYWFTTSSQGSYLIEWDNKNQVASFVLQDTRALGSRVLDLKEGKLITGIFKIINDDPNDDLLCWTDDNIEPCYVNIERAKTYGENGFEKEDIYWIKKPPRFAPTAELTYATEQSNNIAEKFLLFSYRYQYLDNEWSALSSFTNYAFSPLPYQMDYYTLDNLGMVNAFNAVSIGVNSGDKRVKAVQVVFKESNSNTLFIIDTFDKRKEGWLDDEDKFFTFSNNKVYQALPTEELYRSFDNVPKKAKSLAIISNRPVFGNYLEGYKIEDANGNPIKIDYSVSLVSNELNTANEFVDTSSNISGANNIVFTNPSLIQLRKDNKITFRLFVKNKTIDALPEDTVYDKTFQYVLPEDFVDIPAMFASDDFGFFFNVIQADFATNVDFLPVGWIKVTDPIITIKSTNDGFELSQGSYTESGTPKTVSFRFDDVSTAYLSETSNSDSCKSNLDYEVGIVYIEEFGRKTTTLTSLTNTLYIPLAKSEFQNKLQVEIVNPPPAFADRFKIVVKAPALNHHVITVNSFYVDGAFVWVKLEGTDKDKVQAGDYLILKRTPERIQDIVIKTKVLEVKEQLKDFISENTNSEPAGYYMKIKPNGFNMNFNEVVTKSSYATANSSGTPTCYADLFSDATTPFPTPALSAGTSIKLKFNSSFSYDDGWSNKIYEKEFVCQRDYSSFEEWYNENLFGRSMPTSDPNYPADVDNYLGKVSLVSGFISVSPPPFNIVVFTPNPVGKKYLKVDGLESGGSNGRKGYVHAWVDIRLSNGDYIFETEQKKLVEQDLFFETEQTFEIIDGNHKGTVQDQDLLTNQNAIITLDFFNCFSQGNGVESYIIKDAFNKPALNIDTRPTTTTVEEYTEVRRYADLTYGEPYVESSGVNGLNVFNLSTKNFKSLDKQFGSVQYLKERDNDLVVLQEEKASKVLYLKTQMMNSDGTVNLIKSDLILNDQVPYLGENGVGTNPESVAIHDFQIFYVNPRRGTPQRLSIDGVTAINNGMVDYFRDLFINQPTGIKLGGWNPYDKQYYLTVKDEPVQLYEVKCSNEIFKSAISEAFTYRLQLNSNEGEIALNYNITSGNATILAVFDGDSFVDSNVTGIGNITIPRENLDATYVDVTITPVGGAVTYSVMNNCPLGIQAKVVSIVINDDLDVGQTITNQFKWGSNPFYSTLDTFSSVIDGLDVLDGEYFTRFEEKTGIEGEVNIPMRGETITMRSFKDIGNSATFNLSKCNKLGYLISTTVYTSDDIDTIRSLATYPTITVGINTYTAQFVFGKTLDNEILYLIWDYIDKGATLVNDEISVLKGDAITFNALGNDTYDPAATIEILTDGANGSTVINLDDTFTYTHDDSDTTTDVVTYRVTQNGCPQTATISVNIYTEETAPELFAYNAARAPFSYSCGGPTSTVVIYVDVQPFSSPDWFTLIGVVYSDAAGTIPAPNGWYVDELTPGAGEYHFFYWNGLGVSDVDTCTI